MTHFQLGMALGFLGGFGFASLAALNIIRQWGKRQ